MKKIISGVLIGGLVLASMTGCQKAETGKTPEIGRAHV